MIDAVFLKHAHKQTCTHPAPHTHPMTTSESARGINPPGLGDKRGTEGAPARLEADAVVPRHRARPEECRLAAEEERGEAAVLGNLNSVAKPPCWAT